MPDITMCLGSKDGVACKLREKCYRYLAKPSPFQSFFETPPYVVYGRKKHICAHLWEMDKDGNNKRD